jgi:hypothetical protein
MWRHGDVLIAAIDAVPQNASLQTHTVLARGEITGHSHRVAEPKTAELWQLNDLVFLKVVAPQATLVHQEHKPITLPRGTYRVWIQREYTPAEIRRVAD